MVDKQYVFDSSALICGLLKEDGYETVNQLLLSAENSDCLLYVSAVQIGEVLYTMKLRANENTPSPFEMENIVKELPLEVIDATIDQAISAARWKMRGGIAYADAYVLDIAERFNAAILTKDQEFKQFEQKVSIHWL